MALILNILWNIPGLGFVIALLWLVAAGLMTLTIIGIPWAIACLTMASFAIAPFGRDLVSREELTGRRSLGTGPLGVLANVLWFLLAGLWLCIAHVAAAAACAITIIGLPFAWAHLKLAGAALFPVGKRVVPGNVSDAIRRRRGDAALDQARSG
jgi:uncharacterized membrane protein YccF (DUF307 family)